MAEEQGFQTELLPFPVQLWSGRMAAPVPREDIKIEPVTSANYEECLRIESIKEFGGREIREKAFAMEFAHPDFVHFLLRVNGEAACSLCLFWAGPYIRVENVATLSSFRGQGLIGHLLRHAQEEFLRLGGEQLWVCPINEKVEKVYNRYGFDTVGEMAFSHAFLGGKGILELR
ncbi:GNAT family N-acetyltransferase [Brevibacillus ruminantium]|uniref:GNAT family N-acetyltransferase n=1 Tax=Brevibacillus ruminantium TaxID=2950604 RepID=A0ABY4WCC8_9BACL|nr:GNAT family N-acetyltransferase [Brevibacillus ruminantium]USG64717.1 GNAT family N-acetyltransferase [Brevibacillus ruminantium]